MLKDKAVALLSPFPGLLGKPQSSQGPNILSKHVFNKDPGVRRKKIIAKDPETAASIKVNSPMRLNRFKIPCKEPTLTWGIKNESKENLVF